MNEKKIAVYLTEMDWRAVTACLYSQIAERALSGVTIWTVGRNRVQYIARQIEARMPASPVSAGEKP